MQPCRPIIELHISVTSPDHLNTPANLSAIMSFECCKDQKKSRYGKWVSQRKLNVQVLSADWEQISTRSNTSAALELSDGAGRTKIF